MFQHSGGGWKQQQQVGPSLPPHLSLQHQQQSLQQPPLPPPLPNDQPQQHQNGTGTNGVGGSTTTTTGSSGGSTTTTTRKAHVRSAAGKVWVDATLSDWPEDDFRLFVGNLAPEITDQDLLQHFLVGGTTANGKNRNPCPSAQRARVIRQGKEQLNAGYGFVSFLDALECARALRETDQSWLGSRPIRVKRSHWKDREMKNVRKKQKQHDKHRKRMGLA